MFPGAGATVSPQAFVNNSKQKRVMVGGEALPVSRLYGE